MADLIQDFNNSYLDFLRDESRLVGDARAVSFPRSEIAVRDAVLAVRATGGTITVQGARTGIAGGAVPEGGCIINLSRLKAIKLERLNDGILNVEAGALLSEVRSALEPSAWIFPPDPTETSASIGGMMATNASGAMSFHYGPTRKWVTAIHAVLADGSRVDLRRGVCKARGRDFVVVTSEGREITGRLPSYLLPAVKSAAGYYAADDMDLVDLFIGMEGTLGLITGAELRLLPRPDSVCGLTIFLPSLESALALVRLARGEQVGDHAGLSTRPVAIEFFNHDTLELLRRMRTEGRGSGTIPELPPHYHTALYLEYHGADGDVVEGAALAAIEAATRLGGSDEDSWYASTPRDLEHQKAFRHAVPESVNMLIGERQRVDPAIVKLGTDMSVPDACLESVMDMYREDLVAAGLESVIFGHIGNNHVHVNILPRSRAEYDRGRSLYQEWAARVVGWGGSVSAEHGIGRLKVGLLARMFGAEGIAEMRALKRVFDPEMVLNPGVLFS